MLTMLAGTPAYAQQALPPIFDPTGRSGEPPAPLKKEFKPPTPMPLPTLPGNLRESHIRAKVGVIAQVCDEGVRRAADRLGCVRAGDELPERAA